MFTGKQYLTILKKYWICICENGEFYHIAVPLNSRLFQILCKEKGAKHKSLLLHTEVCWLSPVKVLRRIYKLEKKSWNLFLRISRKSTPGSWVDDELWWIKLAYLTDIFGYLNELDTNMQGRNETLWTTTDKLYGFLLNLWQTNFAQGFLRCFPLRKLLRELWTEYLKKSISSHLEMLQQRFKSYFPDLNVCKYDWVTNPFNQSAVSNPSKLKLKAQEQVAEICMDRTLQIQLNGHRQFLAHCTAGIPRDLTTSCSDYFALFHSLLVWIRIFVFITDHNQI